MSLEQQLIDLEIRLTHQQKLIATLDEVVREFATRVERLERQVAGQAATAAGEAVTTGPGDEPPPHY